MLKIDSSVFFAKSSLNPEAPQHEVVEEYGINDEAGFINYDEGWEYEQGFDLREGKM